MIYCVVIIEHASDSPGVDVAYGPFDADEADKVAAEIVAEHPELERGVHVQVATLQGFGR